MSAETRSEIVIIGGGPAGAAAATLLARAGRSVKLVEREAAPQHKVCGEFLSREALASLSTLGIGAAALGAVSITHVRLAGARSSSASPLPFAAMSLTRRTLDEALLARAAQAGANVVRGHAVQSLLEDAEGFHATLASGDTLHARAAFLATGKHDLRGWPRPPGRQDDLLAFKMYWRLAPAQAATLASHVELILYRGGYAGLQPVEDGAANLCCLIQREEFRRLGNRWDTFLAAMREQSPLLAQRLEGAEPLLGRPLAIASIPYGLLRPPTGGAWCLGDQAAVIPSFTGDGMSIALHSAQLAAEMYLRGESSTAFQQRLRSTLSRQLATATFFSRNLVAHPRLLSAAARVYPGVLRFVAAATRISANPL